MSYPDAAGLQLTHHPSAVRRPHVSVCFSTAGSILAIANGFVMIVEVSVSLHIQILSPLDTHACTHTRGWMAES